MASLKYSRQREAIKDYLSSVTTHPTADTVYMHIKEEFPNISLGTVYRNLNLLADIGGLNRRSVKKQLRKVPKRSSQHSRELIWYLLPVVWVAEQEQEQLLLLRVLPKSREHLLLAL